jgi:hypothetical protein
MKLICAPKEKKLLGTKEVGGKEEACLIDRPPIFFTWISTVEKPNRSLKKLVG